MKQQINTCDGNDTDAEERHRTVRLEYDVILLHYQCGISTHVHCSNPQNFILNLVETPKIQNTLNIFPFDEFHESGT